MDLVTATVVTSPVEAEVVAGRLRLEGVEALVATDDAGGQEPQLSAIRGIRILVDRADLSAAREILELPEVEVPERSERADVIDQTWIWVGAAVVILAIVGWIMGVAGLPR